jgi:hypothetical protein
MIISYKQNDYINIIFNIPSTRLFSIYKEIYLNDNENNEFAGRIILVTENAKTEMFHLETKNINELQSTLDEFLNIIREGFVKGNSEVLIEL